ncbi:hypothetical protein Tco_0561136 [Tanacetum coccineum]
MTRCHRALRMMTMTLKGISFSLKNCLAMIPLHFWKNELFHFNISSSSRPPAKPPDDGIYFEPDTGILTVKVDCPDFKASCACGFCPPFTRASNPQLHYGNPIS